MSSTSHSKCWIHTLAIVGITWAILPPLLSADSPYDRELSQIREANLLIDELATTRLEVEDHYLQQLRSLRANGHASWLEVARQEVVVNSIRAQRDHLHRYQHFIEDLAAQLNQIPASHLSAAHATPWKLHFAGSIRLAGWLDSDSLPAALDGESIQVGGRRSPPVGQEQIQKVEAKVKRYRSQMSQFENDDTVPGQWRSQAQLHWKQAVAELRYLVARRQADAEFSLPESIVTEVVAAEAPSLNANHDPDLLHWVRQVAWAEANALAAVNTKMLELQRQVRKLAALEALQQHRFATATEVSQAKSGVRRFSEQLVHEQDRIRFLQHQFSKLPITNADQEFVTLDEDLFESRLEGVSHCPTQVFTDLHRLRYLIDLRRRYYNLEGQLAAETQKLQMQEAFLERLKLAEAKTQKHRSNVGIQSTKLKTVLSNGRDKEAETLQLEIEISNSRLQDFKERLAIFALEEQRFMAQCEMQNQWTDGSFVSFKTSPDTTNLPAFTDPNEASKRGSSYLETDELDWSKISIQSAAQPDYLSFSFEQRTSSPLIHSNRNPLTFYPAKRRTESRNLSLHPSSHLYERSSYNYRPPVLPQPFSIGPRNNHSTYSSQYIYPNGILRSELRSRVPVGQIPFYLPGSPTNVR